MCLGIVLPAQFSQFFSQITPDMFIKLSVIFSALAFAIGQDQLLDWELAVAVNDQIQLIQSNGSIIKTTGQPFSMLKAVTYDNIRDQFIVSDTDHRNDTIFTIQLSNETDIDITPIVQDLPDDVLGLAIDPLTDTLYWTDALNGTINYVALNETYYESKQLFTFEHDNPRGIAVDICKRYIYWANRDSYFPSIKRARLDGSELEILVNTDILSPGDLAIDYKNQRLYWTDTRGGYVYGRIESISLDGKEREVVFEDSHVKPFGIAVDGDKIYFTDTVNRVVNRIDKSKRGEKEKIVVFEGEPRGIVMNNFHVKDLSDCKVFDRVENYKENEKIEASEDNNKEFSQSHTVPANECLNEGELIYGTCLCKRGFTGKYCETSLCHNLCMHGSCFVSFLGKASCKCDKGFVGTRCERSKCDDFCLNGGDCTIVSPRDRPQCECPERFMGDRCEYSSSICDLYCDREDDFFSEKYELLCRCNEGFPIFPGRNRTSAKLLASSEEESFLTKLSDPLYYLTFLILICLVIIIALIVYIRLVRKRRPRIKKRYIVNKNVTPLTSRPQPNTEQCEITIENCCNMNVCETPCFEPRNFQEDKKTLLSDMEGGDVY